MVLLLFPYSVESFSPLQLKHVMTSLWHIWIGQHQYSCALEPLLSAIRVAWVQVLADKERKMKNWIITKSPTMYLSKETSYSFSVDGTVSISDRKMKLVLTWIILESLRHTELDIFWTCCWVTQSCPTLCNPMDCSMPGFPVHHRLLEFAQIHAHLISDAIQPSHPLSSPSPPAFSLSQHQGLFQWVTSGGNIWSFSFSISPFSEYSRLISFVIDWFDLLAVQGTLKSLLQNHSLEASNLQHSAFFMNQLIDGENSQGGICSHMLGLVLVSSWYNY